LSDKIHTAEQVSPAQLVLVRQNIFGDSRRLAWDFHSESQTAPIPLNEKIANNQHQYQPDLSSDHFLVIASWSLHLPVDATVVFDWHFFRQ
jgi:hypothetical protein